MIRSRLGFKALGLCALLLGLMAVGTGSAQAEVGSNWMVNGTNISSGLLPFVQVKELENNDASLLTEVAGIKVKLLCTAAETEEFHFLVEGGSLGKLKLTGCVIFLQPLGKAEELAKNCEPFTELAGGVIHKGVILTNLIKDLIVLHLVTPNGALEVLDRLEPNVAGQPFYTTQLGELCAIGEELPLFGTIYLKDCKGLFSSEQVTHLIEEHSLTHLWFISLTAEHKATIDGSAVLELEGVSHKGLKWSGLPKATKA